MKIQLLTIHFPVSGVPAPGILAVENIKALKELVEYGRKAEVFVCLENVNESVEDLQAAIEAVPDLGITLDVGHAERIALGASCEIIRRVGSAIQHIHLHDNWGPELGEDCHLPIGKGVIDFSRILRHLLRAAYNGPCTLEIGMSDLQSSRKFLRELLVDPHEMQIIRSILDEFPEAHVTGGAALALAIESDRLDLFELLLDGMKVIDERNDEGLTPLMLAVKADNTEMIRRLLERGADANTRNTEGRTALMFACEAGNYNTAELLLDKGADPLIRDHRETTAFSEALLSGNEDVCHLLFSRSGGCSGLSTCGRRQICLCYMRRKLECRNGLIV